MHTVEREKFQVPTAPNKVLTHGSTCGIINIEAKEKHRRKQQLNR